MSAAAFSAAIWSGGLIGVIFGVGIFYWMGVSYGRSEMQSEAIDRDYGQYCRKTGEWAWKGECDA